MSIASRAAALACQSPLGASPWASACSPSIPLPPPPSLPPRRLGSRSKQQQRVSQLGRRGTAVWIWCCSHIVEVAGDQDGSKAATIGLLPQDVGNTPTVIFILQPSWPPVTPSVTSSKASWRDEEARLFSPGGPSPLAAPSREGGEGGYCDDRKDARQEVCLTLIWTPHTMNWCHEVQIHIMNNTFPFVSPFGRDFRITGSKGGGGKKILRGQR